MKPTLNYLRPSTQKLMFFHKFSSLGLFFSYNSFLSLFWIWWRTLLTKCKVGNKIWTERVQLIKMAFVTFICECYDQWLCVRNCLFIWGLSWRCKLCLKRFCYYFCRCSRKYKLPYSCIIPFPKATDPSTAQEFTTGCQVLAVYPGTTALYRAAVAAHRKVLNG